MPSASEHMYVLYIHTGAILCVAIRCAPYSFRVRAALPRSDRLEYVVKMTDLSKQALWHDRVEHLCQSCFRSAPCRRV